MSKTFPRIGWAILVSLLCISLAILPACGGGGGGGGPTIPYKNDGIFVQDSIGGLDSLDPAWAYDTASGEQIQYMYDTLVFYDGTSTDTFVPRIATNWTVVNATQMRFCINTTVKFWNNDTVTAEDVAYSFWRAMVQDRAGGPTWMFNLPLTGYFRSRSGGAVRPGWLDTVFAAVQVDGDCVVFNFAGDGYPTLPWLQIICNTWASIVNEDWCVAHGDWSPNYTGNYSAYNNPSDRSNTALYNKAMGNGPWIGPTGGTPGVNQGTWTPGTSIILNKFDGYYRGVPPFNQVICYFRDVWSARKLDLQNGNADLVYVPRNYRDEVINWTDLNKIFPLPELTVDTIFFNQCIGENTTYCGNKSLVGGNGIPLDFFQDANIRKGFAYAFDYDTYLTDVLMGEAAQMASPIIQTLWGYKSSWSKYSHCLTMAKSLLQATSSHGNLSTTGFTFTLCYNTGNVPRKTACDMLAATMVAIDPKFHVNVQAVAWDAYLPLIFTPSGVTDLPMFQIGWQCDYPDADNFLAPYMGIYGDFSSYQCYGNSTIEDLLTAERYMANNATRQGIFDQLAAIYYYDAPGIMLFQPEGRRWFTKYIHGYYFNPTIPGLPGPLFDMTKSAS
jgi:peptide/nickel transport system substrate-binding protein